MYVNQKNKNCKNCKTNDNFDKNITTYNGVFAFWPIIFLKLTNTSKKLLSSFLYNMSIGQSNL